MPFLFCIIHDFRYLCTLFIDKNKILKYKNGRKHY